MNSGIYKITCGANGKIYVGQSSDLGSRKRQHWDKLRLNRHPNKRMQADWNGEGNGTFRFDIIEYCPIEQLNERETYWIHELKSTDPSIGYNKQVGGSYQEKRLKDKPKYQNRTTYKSKMK